MSEGTKLGDQKELEFDKRVSQESSDILKKSEFSGTKLGEVSDFEKSLGLETETEGSTETTETVEEDAPVEPAEIKEEVVSPETAEEPKKEVSEEQSLFEEALEYSIADYQAGDVIKGKVRQIEKSGIFVDIGYKSDGFIPNVEFSFNSYETPSKLFSAGDEINVMIEKIETKEGYCLLSRKKAEHELAWSELENGMDNNDKFEVKIGSSVNAGVVATYKGIRAFIPMSQLNEANKNDLESLVGTVVTTQALNVDRRRKKVVLSCRGVQDKESSEALAKLLDSFEEGQVIKGRVSSVKPFGAFVDIGGIEGLVHISELSWSRINNPEEVVSVGDEVSVSILKINKAEQKVSLGMKQLETDPWEGISERYELGQVIKGTISRLVPFGAFMQLEKHLEGLVHISELSSEHVSQVSDYVSVGDEVDAKIINLEPTMQRIGLSIKALANADEEAPKEVPQADAVDTSDTDTVSVENSVVSETEDSNTDLQVENTDTDA